MGAQGCQGALSCFETDAKIRCFLEGGMRLRAIVCDLMRFDAHRTRFGAEKALQIMCDEVCFTENWRGFYGVPSQSMMAFASRGVKVFRFLL